MPEEKEIAKNMETSSVGGDSLVAGKSLKFYWQSVRWFIIILVALEAINIIYGNYNYGHWIIEAFVFLLFNFWLMRMKRVELKAAMTATIFLGIGSGLLLAIFEIIWYYQVVYLLNLLRQPVIVTVVGMVVGFTFYLLFKSLLSNKDNKDLKGGGTYGRKTNVNNRFR